MLDNKKKEDRVVFFMADDTASYGKLVAALDGAKQAGAKVVAFATEIPEGAVLPGAPGSVPAAPAPSPSAATWCSPSRRSRSTASARAWTRSPPSASGASATRTPGRRVTTATSA